MDETVLHKLNLRTCVTQYLFKVNKYYYIYLKCHKFKLAIHYFSTHKCFTLWMNKKELTKNFK